MTLTQRLLREHAAVRLQRARPDLAERYAAADPAALLARRSGLAAEPGGHAQGDPGGGAPGGDPDGRDAASMVAVVLRDLNVPMLMRHAWLFAASLETQTAAEWRAAFSRTVFLAGNPLALGARFPFAQVADDRSAAWFGPGSTACCMPLRRLTKPFTTAATAASLLPARPVTVLLPGDPAADGGGAHFDLHLATAGLSVVQALIHLHHLLAEAALDGVLAAGDSLTLRQVPRLAGLERRPAALRVDLDPADPTRLQAFAALTRETLDV